MTTAPPPEGGSGDAPSGASQPPEAPFDPYRFGAPSHPIDPAYAPPGYVPPPPAYPPAPSDQPPSYPGYPPPPPGYPGQQFPGAQFPGAGGGGYPPSGYPPAPQQYGQPVPPQYGQPYGYGAPNPYGAVKPSNGLAVTALVLGIISLVFCWVPFFDGLIIIPAIVFGIVGINAAKRRGGIGRSMAIVGLVLAIVAAVGCTAISAYIVSNCSTTDNGFGSRTTHCSIDDNN